MIEKDFLVCTFVELHSRKMEGKGILCHSHFITFLTTFCRHPFTMKFSPTFLRKRKKGKKRKNLINGKKAPKTIFILPQLLGASLMCLTLRTFIC
jgi:hypothetical protein